MDKKKRDPSICCLQETHLKSKDTEKVKRWEKVFHANRYEKRAYEKYSDKIDFKQKSF